MIFWALSARNYMIFKLGEAQTAAVTRVHPANSRLCARTVVRTVDH